MHGPVLSSRSGLPRVGARLLPLVDRKELIALAILLIVYVLWYSDNPTMDFVPINIGGPAALMVILLMGAWRQIRNSARYIWAPLFWFRISCALYFGFGSIVPYIANDATAFYIKAVYDFSEQECFKAGFITLVSIFTVLLTVSLVPVDRQQREQSLVYQAKRNQSLTLYFAVVLLVVGAYIRYVILLPVAFGMETQAAGLVMGLGKLYAVGLYLLTLYGLRASKAVIVIAVVLIVIDIVVGLVTFAKMEVLVTLLFSYLAILHHKLTIKRALIGLALVIGVYSQISPIVGYGRDELATINGNPLMGTFQQRFDILNSYSDEISDSDPSKPSMALSRICYLSFSSLVISWYDTSRPGASLRNLLYIFIPRFIWPDKPVISAVGTELYREVTGLEGSSVSAGWFSEAYWNLGWSGIPLIMIPVGLILAYLSKYCIRMMTQERWMHLPAVLSAVWLGTRVDGALVMDVFGGGAVVIVYALACTGAESLLMQRKRLR